MSIMDLQSSFRRTTSFVFIEYPVTFFWVSNYHDAISFPLLKIKPVKSTPLWKAKQVKVSFENDYHN